jgi:hypothetical protein
MFPLQYSHYFETTYDQSYNINNIDTAPHKIRTSQDRELKAFPGHQPVLDPSAFKQNHQPFLTTMREAYKCHSMTNEQTQ